MAVFRVQVFYRRDVDEKWTNVYHVDVAAIGDAVTPVTDTLIPGLLPLLDSSCQIYKALISDPSSTDFVEIPFSSAGTSTASGDMLPLFNCVKELIQTAALGRPDVKFLKGFITESIQTNGVLTSGAAGVVTGAISDLITAMSGDSAPLVSESGDVWATNTTQSAVQMRQMHRKRRRTP